MEYRKIIFRARQFGGVYLVWAYVKLGLGGMVARQVILLLTGRRSRDEVYQTIRRAVFEKLQKQYHEFLLKRETYYGAREEKEEVRNNKVWTCWLQGFDYAPEIVKTCIESMKHYLTDREIIPLDYNNYTKYVTLPNDVIRKYENGKISAALFSDLLRLELLIKYGGTWMDATVLVTDPHLMMNTKWLEETMNCDLFAFQAIVKGDEKFYGISNWFLTSCANNKVLMVLRDVLIQYWHDYSVTLDYYMFHDFFYAIAQLYPEEITAMPRRNRLLPLMLMQRIEDRYDEAWMKKLTERCCFHKLNYRLSKDVLRDTGNFYHKVIQKGLKN